MEFLQDVLYDLKEFSDSRFEVVALFRMIIASICGGLIGLEREMKGRPAGLKTFSLVCIGATLAMITNEYISIYYGGSGEMCIRDSLWIRRSTRSIGISVRVSPANRQMTARPLSNSSPFTFPPHLHWPKNGLKFLRRPPETPNAPTRQARPPP